MIYLKNNPHLQLKSKTSCSVSMTEPWIMFLNRFTFDSHRKWDAARAFPLVLILRKHGCNNYLWLFCICVVFCKNKASNIGTARSKGYPAHVNTASQLPSPRQPGFDQGRSSRQPPKTRKQRDASTCRSSALPFWDIFFCRVPRTCLVSILIHNDNGHCQV